MNIDRMRYFAAVVECGNLRKAAELVGISPASMSKSISTLEAEVGYKLLRPEGRGIAVTDNGMTLYQNSSRLLEEYQRFKKSLEDLSPVIPRSKLRMASFEVFSSYFLSSFLPAIPHEEILLLELTPGDMERAVIEGQVDYGITYIPQPSEKLDFKEIGSFEMKIYGLAKWNELPFNEWPFAVPTTSINIQSQKSSTLDLWPNEQLNRKVKFEFELLETALQTTRLGHSVIHCPDFIISLHNQVVSKNYSLECLTPPKKYKGPKRTTYLISKKGDPESMSLERKLAKFMRHLTTL